MSQHWFEQCNLPPPGTATEDDNVSTTSDCSDFSDDFFDCDDYFPLDEDPIEPNPANLEPLSVPFSMWFNINNFGFIWSLHHQWLGLQASRTSGRLANYCRGFICG